MKRIFLSVLIPLAVILPAAAFAAAYAPYRGQTINIQKPGQTAPAITLTLSDLNTISTSTLNVSIFGLPYAVDISQARIIDKKRATSTLSFLIAGDKVNVVGLLDAANTSLIHAQIVQTPLRAATSTPTTPPPGANASLTDALYDHASNPLKLAKASDASVRDYQWNKPVADWNLTTHSQNLPLIAKAAMGDYRFFADLANLETQQGLYGREFGSPGFYFSFPFAAKVVALRDARAAGDTVSAAAIADEMQAVLALWSLVAVPTPRTSETVNERGRMLTGTGDAAKYRGLSVAVAGERWHGGEIASNDVDTLLSWALDAPRNISTPAANGNLRRGTGKWWQSDIAWVAGVDSYSATTDPAIWGLTADSRAKLLSIANGNTTNVAWAISLVQKYGVWKTTPVRLRRTSLGTETVFFNSANGNKPTEAATSITTGGEWKSMRPCSGPGVGANGGYTVTIASGTITASASDTAHCATVTQSELGGTIIYEVIINGKTVTTGANQRPPTGGGGPGPGGPGPGPDPNDDPPTGGGGGGNGGNQGFCDVTQFNCDTPRY